jgi:predicted dehydrogenase
MFDNNDAALNRRDLLSRGSLLALGLLVGGSAGLRAEELVPEATLLREDEPEVPATPVSVAVIGLGEQGRTILTALTHAPGANIAYVCDSYAGAQPRAKEIAPKAQPVEDYRKVLDDKTVQAVFVATPTHLHRQIVVDALAAGKHVYCEAPLAHTIEDARAIAKAATAAQPKLIFHTGLQQRTNPQHKHVLGFVRTGALATIAQTKATWHKKDSWRRQAPGEERQRALNWRLRKATSPGLMGEIGVHQVDVNNWFLKKLPTAVTGFGGIMAWRDGRDVPDTVQCVLEYPGDVRMAYDATLANSFDGAYELFQGTDSAVLIRDGRAWMFKESDAAELGWEVYAYKEKVGDDTGIALVADATKLLAQGLKPGENRSTDPTKGALYFASTAFLNGIRTGRPTVSGAKEGWEATVTALKANEAVLSGGRIILTPETYTL